MLDDISNFLHFTHTYYVLLISENGTIRANFKSMHIIYPFKNCCLPFVTRTSLRTVSESVWTEKHHLTSIGKKFSIRIDRKCSNDSRSSEERKFFVMSHNIGYWSSNHFNFWMFFVRTVPAVWFTAKTLHFLASFVKNLTFLFFTEKRMCMYLLLLWKFIFCFLLRMYLNGKLIYLRLLQS